MTSKGLYWIALGVFAVGMHSEYRNGGFTVAHQVAGRAEAVLCRTATRVEQTLVMAGIVKGHQSNEWPNEEFVAQQQEQIDRVMAQHQAEIERAMAFRQADLDRVQQRLARVQVVMNRVQVEKLRNLDRMRFKFADAGRREVFVCPQSGRQISIEADAQV